jgi:hypothetical protein
MPRVSENRNGFFRGARETETRERVACGLELIRALDLQQMNEEAGMGLAYLIDTLQAALRQPPVSAEVSELIRRVQGAAG